MYDVQNGKNGKMHGYGCAGYKKQYELYGLADFTANRIRDRRDKALHIRRFKVIGTEADDRNGAKFSMRGGESKVIVVDG